MKNILSFLIVIFILSACSNDDELDNNNFLDISGKGYLKAIYKNGYIIKEYAYNNDGLLSKKLDYGTLIEYSYTEDTVFEKSNYYVNKYYIKNENVIAKEYNEASLYQEYFFTNECSYIRVNEYDLSHNYLRKTEYGYTENCGYTSTQFNENNELRVTRTFTKDNKNAFNKKAQIPLLKIENNHNIIKKEYYYLGSLNEGQSYINIITYNSDNYPINKRREYYDGDIDEFVYEYY